MSNDLVERLRKTAEMVMPHYPMDVCTQAADEIESLRDRLSFAEFEWHRATDGMKERDAVIETLRTQLDAAKQVASYETLVAQAEIDECQRLRLQLASAKRALHDISFYPWIGEKDWYAVRTTARDAVSALTDDAGKP